MPKMKPGKATKKKKTDATEALSGRSAKDLFSSEARKKLLDKGVQSLREREGVYKNLSNR